MVFVWEAIPISFRARNNSIQFIEILVTGDTLDLLFGEKSIFFIFLILRYDENNFFYLWLKEKQRFLDFYFIRFQIYELVELCYFIIHCLGVLLIVSIVDFGFKLTSNFFKIGKYLCLKVFNFIFQLAHAVFFHKTDHLIHNLQFFIQLSFSECKSVFKSIEFCPQLYKLRFYFIYLFFDHLWWCIIRKSVCCCSSWIKGLFV